MPATSTRPITVTLVDDYDVVLTGLAHMFDRFRDRIDGATAEAAAELKRKEAQTPSGLRLLSSC